MRSINVVHAIVLVVVVFPAAARAAGPVTAQPRAGDPLHGLTRDQMAAFALGALRYNTPLSSADGLGPVFNKESCANCHVDPTGVSAEGLPLFGGSGSQTVTRFGLITKGGFDPLADLGGSLLQHSSISEACAETVPDMPGIHTAFRRTNGGMMGYGLIEAIPDAAICAVQAAQSPAVQGAVHCVSTFESAPPPAGEACASCPPGTRVGRFGWKAQVATIETFTADAALNELGFTNRHLPFENDPNGIDPPELGPPDDCDTVADPEDSVAFGNGVDKEFIDVITDFQRFLAPAPQTPRTGMTGEAIFTSIGCAECHHPSFTTSDDAGLEDAIRDKIVRPWSDFLLHDMGAAADGIPQGDATGRDIRTAPLMGVRFRDPMWHDASIGGGTLADRIVAAVDLHRAFGSQAAASGDAFVTLNAAERQQVIDFLDSLGQAEFDWDGDNDIEVEDFHGFGDPAAFLQCASDAAIPILPDDPCAIHDVDADGDVDGDDLDVMVSVLGFGESHDCNGNGINDLVDIFDGTSSDENGNGVPDECCPADADGDGEVNVDDLVRVIMDWGDCPPEPTPCPADFNDDDVVNVNDLNEIIVNWGDC